MSISTLVLLLLCLQAAFVDSPAKPPGGPVKGDAQDLLILAAERPILLKVHLQVDGRGFRGLQDDFLNQLFGSFDADKDGVWSEAEAAVAQDSGKLAPLGENGRVDGRADLNKNGRYEKEEVFEHARGALGEPFRVQLESQSPFRQTSIQDRLDRNADGRVSMEELRNARQALGKLDLDDDEILSAEELVIPDESGLGPSQVSVDLPILALTSATRVQAAQELLRRYGTGSAASLDVGVLQWPAEVAKAIDIDANGLFNEAELVQGLSAPVPQVEWLVQLPKASGRITTVQVWEPLQEGSRKPAVAASMPFALAGFRADVRGMTTRAEVSDNRNFYAIQFLRADADKNQYLSESEFGSVDLRVPFAQVDRNKDGMIKREELLEYVNLDSQLVATRVTLLVANDGKGLFELMDSSLDGRITASEFASAADRLSARDVNRDGQLDASELLGRYRLTFGLEKPRLFQQMTRGSRMTSRTPRRPKGGPAWFNNMDRNRDGEVSAREFLGPPAAFQKLDTDANGVLSVIEAVQ